MAHSDDTPSESGRREFLGLPLVDSSGGPGRPGRPTVRSRWRVVAVVLALAAFGLLVPLPFRHRAVGAVGDLCHAPLFGGLTWLALVWLGRWHPIVGQPWSLSWRVVGVSAGVFTLGLMAEWAQGHLGRSAAWHDAVANGWGIAAAATLFGTQAAGRTGAGSWGWICRAAGWAAAAVMLAFAWVGPLTVLADVLAKHRQFPLLASFESEVELQRWYFRHASASLVAQQEGARQERIQREAVEEVPHGRSMLRMNLRPADIAGGTLFELPADWSAMEQLKLEVRLSGEYREPTAQLLIKVADTRTADFETDVFREIIRIGRGRWQTISIPRHALSQGPDQRRLDLRRVRYLDLFLVSPVEPVELDVDHVRLTLERTDAAE